MSMSEAFSLLYFNKTLLHKSSERSSLVTGPRLTSPLEVKNPGIFCGSAANFHLGGSSGILQDKVRMLGALVLCSSEHAFCCTLLTLQCACVNEWHTLSEASEKPGSAATSYSLWQKPCWGFIPTCQWTSLVAQMVKHLPTMQETRVQSLDWEDLLEWQPTPVLLPGKSHGQRTAW